MNQPRAQPGEQLSRHLRWRLCGVLLLGVTVIAYEPSAGDPVNRLVIPAAWLMGQNLAAVALGACLLAVIHSSPSSADWIDARAYPGLAALAGVILVSIFARRFRRRIEETREARWAHRRSRRPRTSSLSESLPESD